jgi:hypothetical protein
MILPVFDGKLSYRNNTQDSEAFQKALQKVLATTRKINYNSEPLSCWVRRVILICQWIKYRN